MTIDLKDRQMGCFYGLAIGDALGAAVEFKKPGTFEPVTDYRDGGPWDINPGDWTDDTSMALALADALSVDEEPITQLNNYKEWYFTGKYAVNGVCFDTGIATRSAIQDFAKLGTLKASTDINRSGNGSIMRLAPVPIKYCFKNDLAAKAIASSETTHGSPLCTSACAYMATVVAGLLRGGEKSTVLDKEWNPTKILDLHPDIRAIADGSFRINEIKGTGFVTKSLEAALWAFDSSSDFEESVLKAVNLGLDADTTAAIAGQFAGAYYGYSGIPNRLIDGLSRKDMIDTYFNKLVNN